MQYYQCKCGFLTAWTSMGVHACTRCAKCGSDLAQGPNSHNEPLDHDFSFVEDVETDNGPAPLTRCRYCHKTRKEIDLHNKRQLEALAKYEEAEKKLDSVDIWDLFEKDWTSRGEGHNFPHCDSRVLHAPGECEYCDMPKYKPLHEFRREQGTNYTGHYDADKKQCPAEKRRKLETIEHWHGNIPRPKKSDDVAG